jgi:geranylgeranyl diphosphate synthase type I
VLSRVRELVRPAFQHALERLADPKMRRIAAYQLGWCDVDGRPSDNGGKAIRPALAVLSAQAVGAAPEIGVPGAIAVELIHNFSLLHDDVMDRDVERRHRPSGWVAFGEGQAILAGNAMMGLAIEVLTETESGRRTLPCLLDAVQLLIAGQSQDLLLEQAESAELHDVLTMEAGKTAALLSCASAIGAVAAGASDRVIAGLAGFGHSWSMTFSASSATRPAPASRRPPTCARANAARRSQRRSPHPYRRLISCASCWPPGRRAPRPRSYEPPS